MKLNAGAKSLASGAALLSAVLACSVGCQHTADRPAENSSSPTAEERAPAKPQFAPAPSALNAPSSSIPHEVAPAPTWQRTSTVEFVDVGKPLFQKGALVSTQSAAKPQRYEVWRQRQLIWIGKGYLQGGDLSIDGQNLLVYRTLDYSAHLFELPSGKRLSEHAVSLRPGAVQRVPWVPSGVALWPTLPLRYLLFDETGIALSNAKTGIIEKELLPGAVFDARWSSGGDWLGVIHSAPVNANAGYPVSRTVPELSFYEPAGDGLVLKARLRFESAVNDWSITPDKRRLLVATEGKTLLIDVHEQRLIWERTDLKGRHFAISSNGRLVATTGTNQTTINDTLILLDADDPSRFAEYAKFDNNIDQILFSPSGDAVVTSSYDGQVRLFSTELKSPALHLRKALRHSGRANVYALEFTADGSRLMSTSGDGTVRLWGE